MSEETLQEEFALLVGIDWASEAHQVCVVRSSGTVVSERAVAHDAQVLQDLATSLIEQAGGSPERLAVAIEVPHGVVVETLIERGVAVFAINPKQLDRFRDRFSAAGAKDDRRDARVLADALRTDRRAFTRVVLPPETVVELREESRIHDELTKQFVQATNRLRQHLGRFYPQVLGVGEVSEPWLWELLELAPAPAEAARLRRAPLHKLLTRYRIRRRTADELLTALRAPAFMVAPGTSAAATRHIMVLVPQLRLLHEQLHQSEQRLGALLAACTARPADRESSSAPASEHSDTEILLSLPGVGNQVAATMLAEAWGPLAKRDATTLRPLCGVAPVTRRSGKQLTVVMRYACQRRLRNACHHWARNAVLHDPRSQQHYAALRTKGHRHGRALRGVGDRLLAVLLAMLRQRTLYDAARRAPLRQAA